MTLCNKFQALPEALTSLDIAHTTWMSKASIDDESPYTSQWLESCVYEVDDLNTQVDHLLQAYIPIKPTVQQQMNVLNQQLDSLQKSISSKLEKLLAKKDSAYSAGSSLTPASLRILTNLSDNVQHRV